MDEDEVSNRAGFELGSIFIKMKGVPARFRGTGSQGTGSLLGICDILIIH